MKKKLIGITVCMLLITTAVLPATGLKVNVVKIGDQPYSFDQNNPTMPPHPGCMEGDELDIKADYEVQEKSVYPEIKTSYYEEKIATLIQRLDEDIYLGYLEGLVAFGPRVTGTIECDDAGDYIYDEFVSMGLQARKHEWEDNDLSGFNVEATLPGVDESSDEIYIICAHYDSVPGSPGADDDGSGTAAVLSAARLMSSYVFNHTVRFVAFSGEEQGLYGSYYYVEEAYNNNDNIGAALNADMIGYTEPEEDGRYIVVYHEDHPLEWLTNYTTSISEEYNDFIDLEVISGGYSWRSDHYRFWEFYYSAIFYAEYNYNAYYHSPDDTIEHMDIDYAVRGSRLIIATLAALSEITLINTPDKPSTPEGPSGGKPEVEYSYETSTTDPQEEQVYYWWDWGDGTNSGWLGSYDSGEVVEASHTWTEKGDYAIRVKAKDIYDYESDWSDPLSVTMPKGKPYINTPFIYFLQNFLENHPLIYQLLQRLLNL